jgi:hypothetical protein
MSKVAFLLFLAALCLAVATACTSPECSNMASVVMVGATGATGHFLLEELLNDDAISKVTTITRRPLESADPKLRQVVVENFDNLGETSTEEFLADVCVNALGTTLGLAGSAEKFVKLERDYSQVFMRKAKEAGCKTSVTISAMGANANFPGPLWGPYFLYYVKTMGQKQNAAIDQGFERTVILQPSNLDREQPTIGGSVLSSLPGSRLKVSTMAKAMCKVIKKKDLALGVTFVTGSAEIVKLIGEDGA